MNKRFSIFALAISLCSLVIVVVGFMRTNNAIELSTRALELAEEEYKKLSKLFALWENKFEVSNDILALEPVDPSIKIHFAKLLFSPATHLSELNVFPPTLSISLKEIKRSIEEGLSLKSRQPDVIILPVAIEAEYSTNGKASWDQAIYFMRFSVKNWNLEGGPVVVLESFVFYSKPSDIRSWVEDSGIEYLYRR